MSALKRYLDSLANGPLLDAVTQAPIRPDPDGDERAVIDEAALLKKRRAIKEAYQRAKPLVVPKRRRHKG